MSRPLADIDGSKVEAMAAIGCTEVEIATVLGCHATTLCNRFSKEYHKGRENLKMRLRKKQTEVALGGNIVMLIFLGKQYLGQSDKQEITGAGGGPVDTRITVASAEDKKNVERVMNGERT